MTSPLGDEDEDMQGSLNEVGQERVTRMSLSSEAAEWFVRLRDDRMGVRNRERNVRWLKQSPANIAELLRIQQVYQVLRAAKLQGPSGMAPGESSNIIDLEEQRPRGWSESNRLDLMDVSPIRRRRRWIRPWKLAAAVAGLAVSFLLGFMAKVAWLDRAIETELGEWRTELLTDGSKLRVGPDSLLRVSFGDDHRTIRLVRGEAMFDVAQDRSRPFYVESEMVGVLAVGTEFRVSRLGGKDVVAVTEGTVALYRDGRHAVRGAMPAAPAQIAETTGGVALSAGDQVSITRSTRSKPIAKEKVNVNYEQAWAEGWVVYEDKTVGEVASDFNRFNRLKIQVAEPSLAARRLTFFRGSATDPESFVAALATSPDIAVVRDDPNVLRIELRRPDAEISKSVEIGQPAADVPPSVNPNPI
ncbi:FecR family protein [Steroidobacter agaridevorans]|uniref:FecR family protein n=1 Tax=Steroidobacter agaridevorans TaxID=2695856 RepID=UPI00132ABABB|nr:FecR domain-containing protein [Steroidobacter agaridevorans]GFE90992.1 iron dicitrate transporter FecR [Steroidobacter agaridevorans]